MSDEPLNPFHTPTSNLEHRSAVLSDLPYFSTWWVFVLSIITLYFYALYWLYSRSRILNNILPNDPIPGVLMIGVPVVWIGSIIFDIFASSFQLGVPGTDWSFLFNWTSSLGLIYWVFYIRWRLLYLFRASNLEIKIGPFKTFFFSPFYLSYKINEALLESGRRT